MIWNIFQWRSLKTRVTLFTLAIFIVGIWSLAFYASLMLREDMQRQLGEQQFSTVSLVAAQINEGLEVRVKALESIARAIDLAMLLNNHSAIQKQIDQYVVIHNLFNGGVFILSHDGIAIADSPLSIGRIGLNFMDRKYAVGALKEGKATIGSPVAGKALRSSVFSIAVPIRDAQGAVIGALVGTIDLAQPNFLDKVTENRYGKTGGYLVVAKQYRLIVAATDKSRIMEASPAPGIFPLIDRFLQGYEGTGILVNPLGAEVLQSAKGIPVAGWYVGASLPTAEAFAPINDMQRRLLLAAIFLSLLAGGLTWWMLRRELAPILAAVKTLATFTDTKSSSQPLPITRDDEIGQLIGGFNRLLETLGKKEEALRESQKMEALGTLAGGIAHDFNNAIAAITGNTELARQDVGPGHIALESLEEINKAARRARDLVQQILAFSRRQPLERKPTTLSLVVLESARLVRATLPAGVSLNVECKADTPAVLADASQIKQILLNLCANAIHAVQDHGRPGVVEVRLEVHAQDEARGGLQPGRYACLTVQDNGPGMDEATRARIFEPFFTTKPMGKGTGLGLSVVHGIIKAHEASIEVESTPGEGSTFHICFPAADASVAAVTATVAATAPANGQGKHILYIDDEDAIVFLMQRLLERQGYRVSTFTNPEKALAAVRADPAQFDLAVTDYNMPDMPGLEVATALRDIRADLPVVLASGYITEELRAKAPAAGIRELIYKPDTVDELCEAVARIANAQSAKAIAS